MAERTSAIDSLCGVNDALCALQTLSDLATGETDLITPPHEEEKIEVATRARSFVCTGCIRDGPSRLYPETFTLP